jgi:P-type Ca2+ transporter type 2C
VQILWINIIHDGLPGFALAMEDDDDSIMEEKPIPRDAPILDPTMRAIIFGVGIFVDIVLLAVFYLLFSETGDEVFTRTVVFAALGANSLMNIFSLRSLRKPIWQIPLFSNLYVWAAVLINFLLLMVVIYWPPAQVVMQTVALPVHVWFLVFLGGFASMLAIEIVKMVMLEKTSKA